MGDQSTSELQDIREVNSAREDKFYVYSPETIGAQWAAYESLEATLVNIAEHVLLGERFVVYRNAGVRTHTLSVEGSSNDLESLMQNLRAYENRNS